MVEKTTQRTRNKSKSSLMYVCVCSRNTVVLYLEVSL